MEGIDLIAKAFSALTGEFIQSEKKARAAASNCSFLLNPVNIETIFEKTSYIKPKLPDNVVSFSHFNADTTQDDFALVFDPDTGKLKKMGREGRQPSNTEHLVYLDLNRAGEGAFFGGLFNYISDSVLDQSYDFDFTHFKGDDSNCTRGGYPYKRPAGWNRKALRVIGKYEDDVWLGEGGWRDESSPGEWAVSYHGTNKENASAIAKDGYDPKKHVVQAYGPGHYSSPYPEVAEEYAVEFKDDDGKNYKCILQNRVNMKNTKIVNNGEYFVTPNPSDIRAYGICMKPGN